MEVEVWREEEGSERGRPNQRGGRRGSRLRVCVEGGGEERRGGGICIECNIWYPWACSWLIWFTKVDSFQKSKHTNHTSPLHHKFVCYSRDHMWVPIGTQWLHLHRHGPSFRQSWNHTRHYITVSHISQYWRLSHYIIRNVVISHACYDLTYTQHWHPCR